MYSNDEKTEEKTGMILIYGEYNKNVSAVARTIGSTEFRTNLKFD
jgi:hypothetical protein